MNIKSISDWKSLKPASSIILSDEQSLLDSKERGLGLNPLTFVLKRVSCLRETNNLATWILTEIDDGKQPLLLMVKFVDENIDFRLYYQFEEFAGTTREGAIQRGDFWLFQRPSDENNFQPIDLKFSTTIVNNEVTYLIKPQNELSGLITENPPRAGITDLLGTIVEYIGEKTDNPELLILEVGNKYKKDGGEIKMYLGCQIHEDEIEVIGL